LESIASNSLSLAMDNVFINGDGVGKPIGIMNANCKIAIAKESAQDPTTIVAENIMKMFARFNMRYLGNAIWLGNQTIMPMLQTLNIASGTAGTLLYMPPQGLTAAPYGTLYGRPLQYTEFCKTLGTEGDLILVDPTQYLGIEKGASTTWSKEVYFIYDKELLKLKYRVDGQMWHNKVFTPANGDTLSPVTTIATRS
jgi:HK97 family phage major capsid protein